MYLCIYVSMYVCMYVMYVCICVYVYVYYMCNKYMYVIYKYGHLYLYLYSIHKFQFKTCSRPIRTNRSETVLESDQKAGQVSVQYDEGYQYYNKSCSNTGLFDVWWIFLGVTNSPESNDFHHLSPQSHHHGPGRAPPPHWGNWVWPRRLIRTPNPSADGRWRPQGQGGVTKFSEMTFFFVA